MVASDFVLADPNQIKSLSFQILVSPKGIGSVGDESNPFLEFEFDVFDKFVPEFGGVWRYDWVGDDVVLVKEEAFLGDLNFVAVGSKAVGHETHGVER